MCGDKEQKSERLTVRFTHSDMSRISAFVSAKIDEHIGFELTLSDVIRNVIMREVRDWELENGLVKGLITETEYVEGKVRNGT